MKPIQDYRNTGRKSTIEPSRILVTGATGFTGGYLARRLAREKGNSVRAFVRDRQRAEELATQGIELSVGDLRDPVSIDRAMEGIDIVYHLAATFRDASVPDKEMWAINAQGVKNMLDAAVRARIKRFVHCSTIGVHGDISGPPADESAPYNPGDIYQETKTAGEKIALEYIQQGKLPIVVFRPGGIYGPGDFRFLKLFRSIKRGFFVMLGSGEVLYQLVYIDDLIDGIIKCGTLENVVGEMYILTGNSPITLNQLTASIAAAVEAPKPRWHFPIAPVYLAGYMCELFCKPLRIEPPIYRRRVDFFRKDRVFTIAKARQELDFCPKVDLETGLVRTANWYREHGLL